MANLFKSLDSISLIKALREFALALRQFFATKSEINAVESSIADLDKRKIEASDIPTSLPANGGNADYATSAGNSDTVNNMHASQFVPKNYGGIAYSDLTAYYTASTNPGYYRIVLPDSVLSIWNMLTIELTVNQEYNNGYVGKILIYCHNDGSNTFPVFKASCLGTLSNNIKIYGSGGKYIYIGGCIQWGTISIDKMLVGDNGTKIDQSGIYIDTTSSLPSTYQTASMFYNIDSGNIGSQSVNYANSAGNADTLDGNHASAFATAGHTHSYIPLEDKGLSNGKVPYYVNFPDFQLLANLGYNDESTKIVDEYYFKGICKWAIDNFSGNDLILLIGNANPNSVGYCIIQLYSNAGKDDNTGLPRYCSGTYLGLDNVITNFVCSNAIWSWGGKFNGNASTATNVDWDGVTNKPTKVSQFTNDAGYITESNSKFDNYLPLSGGTITGELSLNQYLKINAWSGYGSGTANLWYDGNTNILQWQNAKNMLLSGNTILHSGNYNSYSPKLDGTGASGTWGINISGNSATATTVDWSGVTNKPTKVSQFTNDAGYVTTDTTYSTATSDTLGLVKIGYAANGKNYPVQLSNGQMYVNVPWTDTDTNTWRPITDSYSDTDSNTSLSQKGGKAIYDALVNGYASSAGNADTLDTFHETSFFRARGIADSEKTNWDTIGILAHSDTSNKPDGLNHPKNYYWGESLSFPGSNGMRLDIFANCYSTAGGSNYTNYGAGLFYRTGWNSTKLNWYEILDEKNYNSYSPKLDGTGASGTWGINISGNAATASSVDWSGVTNKPVIGNGALHLKVNGTEITSDGGVFTANKSDDSTIDIPVPTAESIEQSTLNKLNDKVVFKATFSTELAKEMAEVTSKQNPNKVLKLKFTNPEATLECTPDILSFNYVKVDGYYRLNIKCTCALTGFNFAAQKGTLSYNPVLYHVLYGNINSISCPSEKPGMVVFTLSDSQWSSQSALGLLVFEIAVFVKTLPTDYNDGVYGELYIKRFFS